MQLKNDAESRNVLDEVIRGHYKKNGDRTLNIFLHKDNEEWNGFDVHFLVNRRYVVQYGIIQDRGMWLGGLSLAIGPHYFSPSEFWSYEDAERFRIGADTDDIEHNLRLLDEFFGYPVKDPHVAS